MGEFALKNLSGKGIVRVYMSPTVEVGLNVMGLVKPSNS